MYRFKVKRAAKHKNDQTQVWIDKGEVRWRTNQKRQFTVYFRIYTSGAIAIMFIGQNERARK
jgi:hypothetical protein